MSDHSARTGPWTYKKPSLRWRIAYAANRLPGQCWADLVSYATGSRRWPWQPISSTCRADMLRCGICYCGTLRRPGDAP